MAPPCDVNCESALSAVIEQCGGSMPPIKGGIQAAMVLKVSEMASPWYF